MGLASKLQVLVVDDTSVSRALIVDSLTQLGVSNVRIAKDGKEAFASVCSQPVHLIISDYHMPNGNGLQLLKGVRDKASTSKTGFILITGKSDPDVITVGKGLGMNNYLLKPFDLASLKKCIESVVGAL